MGAHLPGRWGRALAVLMTAGVATAATAAPFVPAADDQVVETWPGGAARAEERRLRSAALQPASDPAAREAAAVSLAGRNLAQARDLGEPRRAGQALAVLAPWPDAETAPLAVLMLRATLQQHLHDFDAARATLEALLQREPRHAQALLTLATLHRVQGRYADADAACQRLVEAGAVLHGQACRAENDGLRGQVDTARRSFEALLSDRVTPAAVRGWLWTSLGELEARDGRPEVAERAWRAALAVDDDAYTALVLADALIEQRRAAEALDLLRDRVRTDAVLLRVAVAGRLAGDPAAGDDAQELQARFAQSAARPQAGHARERAMVALQLDGAPQRALELARQNVAQQREPADLLLLARAARAADDRTGLEQARRLAQEIGLHDARLDAL